MRRALPDETDMWSHTVGRGFFEEHELTTEEMDVGRAICAMPGAMCYLAATESGELAGGAAAAIYSGLATLFADSTIARHRRSGLHRELIAARLNEALAQGCDLATAATLPGSGSQRNYERMGFRGRLHARHAGVHAEVVVAATKYPSPQFVRFHTPSSALRYLRHYHSSGWITGLRHSWCRSRYGS